MGPAYEFASQAQPVPACLADPSTYGSQPNPKPTTPGPGALPYGLCLYGPSAHGLDIYRAGNFYCQDWDTMFPISTTSVQPYSDSVCRDRAAAWPTLFLNADQQACVDYTLSYLCGKLNNTTDPSISKVVMYAGENRVAHLVQKNMGEEPLFKQMWQQCIGAFVPIFTPADPTKQADVDFTKWMNNADAMNFVIHYLGVAICDKNTLLPIGNSGTPPCPNPDPVTMQCPQQTCQIDPTTGVCTQSCPPDHHCTTPPGGGSCNGQGCTGCANPDPRTGLCSGPPSCPPPKVRNPTTGQCQCPGGCPVGQTLNTDTCACSNTCTNTCDDGSQPDPSTCACPCGPGKVKDVSGVCVCANTCPSGQPDPVTCACSPCAAGKVLDNSGSCVCATACPPGQTQDPSTCGCSCDTNQFCPSPTQLNTATCQCECPPPYAVDANGSCACPSVVCPSGQVQDPTTCACTCPDGQIVDPNTGGCTCASSQCTLGRCLDPATCTCVACDLGG
jgi:hypothetical protein